jgi:dihydroorotase
MEALIEAATSGDPRFFAGSDDAAHLVTAKECAEGRPGVFLGPYVFQQYAEVFAQVGKLDKLEDFTSAFGAQFYELPLNEDTVTLVDKPERIEANLEGFVPFMAGQNLSFSIE